MNVFISYSTTDTALVQQIAASLKTVCDSVRWWEDSKVPGEDAWRSIFGWIDRADVVLVVVTDAAVNRGLAVGTEIGAAKMKGKKIIPLVSAGIKSPDLGCLGNLTYCPIDPSNLKPTLDQVHKTLQQLKKERDTQTLVVFGGLVALIAYLSKG